MIEWAEKFVDKDDPVQVFSWFSTTIREVNREQLRFIRMATYKLKRDRLASLMAETENTDISSDQLEEALLQYIVVDYMDEYAYLEEVDRNNRVPGRTKLGSIDFYHKEVLSMTEAAADIIQDRKGRKVLKEYIWVNHQQKKESNEHNKPYYDESARPDDLDELLSQSVREGESLEEEKLWERLADFYKDHIPKN